MTNVLAQHISEHFAVYHGDNVEVVAGLPDASVGLMVSSPPFPSMYVYSNTPRDIGNTSGVEEMLAHFRYLAGPDGLLRVLKPGRSFCVHLTQIPIFKHQEGYVGRRDFRGDVIRLMIDLGWIYHSEVLIDKCPQLRQARTHDVGLQFKSLANDSSVMAPTIPDYLLIFRKPGENPDPIRAGRSAKYKNPDGWITQDEWIEWAAGVWYRKTKDYPGGIDVTDVLGVKAARTEQDEAHLCPLQLGVIERCVKLWSAPGEIVMDPFSGVGSTGYQVVQLNRRYVGVELKESYFRQSIRYLNQSVASRAGQPTLFDSLADEPEPTPAIT